MLVFCVRGSTRVGKKRGPEQKGAKDCGIEMVFEQLESVLVLRPFPLFLLLSLRRLEKIRLVRVGAQRPLFPRRKVPLVQTYVGPLSHTFQQQERSRRRGTRESPSLFGHFAPRALPQEEGPPTSAPQSPTLQDPLLFTPEKDAPPKDTPPCLQLRPHPLLRPPVPHLPQSVDADPSAQSSPSLRVLLVVLLELLWIEGAREGARPVHVFLSAMGRKSEQRRSLVVVAGVGVVFAVPHDGPSPKEIPIPRERLPQDPARTTKEQKKEQNAVPIYSNTIFKTHSAQ